MSKKIVHKDNKYDNTLWYIEYGIDFEKRRIMLDEEIEDGSVGWAIRAIQKMIESDAEAPIDLYINSYGGSIYDGLALFDVLESCPVTIRTHVFGKCCSMGFILYLVGDERYASPRASFMHHAGFTQSEGDTANIKTGLKELERLETVCDTIVAEKTKKKKSWWNNQIKGKDFWFDFATARKLGVVTHELP